MLARNKFSGETFVYREWVELDCGCRAIIGVEIRMTETVMRIEGFINGTSSPFDGQYLVEYDPERDGVAPDGTPMLAYIVTTPDIAKAKRFASKIEAFECWRQISKRDPYGGRLAPDGKPNRPLTAFTVQIGPPEVLVK